MKKKLICLCMIFSVLMHLISPIEGAAKTSKKIVKQPLCSMKKLYYYTEWVKEEFHTKKYTIKKKYWKQAKELKKKILKSNKKVYRVKYKNKNDVKNVRMTFATMFARYTPYEENEPSGMYSDIEYCEVSVSKFKKSLKTANIIRKKINAIIKYLNIDKKTTKVSAMQRFNSWIIGQMTYKDNENHCTTYDGFINGVGVCRTYAYMFRHLCNRVGIECYTVQTKNHEFNATPWGRRILYTDVCWNDTSTNLWEDRTLTWFLIPKKTLYKDHDKLKKKYEDDTRVIKH